MSAGLERLNTLAEHAAEAELHRCCGSRRWARRMVARRPFASGADLLDAAELEWDALDAADRREAFDHHPRIGGQDLDRRRFDATRDWSRREQSRVDNAPEAVRGALAADNDAYFERFGYVFLICAAGKSAEDMLAQLRQRLDNDPETELQIASEAHRSITRLRLEKLVR